MDHHTNDRYTQFPDLKYGVEPVPKTATVPWTWGGQDANINTLIQAWAAVLGSLSGEDTPVFRVDNEPISASRSTGGYRKAILEKSCQECTGFTGIFTNESIRAPDGCTIEVRYCFQGRTGRLVSTGCSTTDYLTGLARQLEFEVNLHAGVLTEARDEFSLSILNKEPQSLPGPTFLHELVQTQGRCSNIAIEFLGPDRSRASLTYDQLHDRSNKLSARIRSQSCVDPTKPRGRIVIPVLLPQSLDLYVAWLAVLKAGAAVCPLSLDAPRDRVNFIVNDVSADIVITRSDMVDNFKGIDREPHAILLDKCVETSLSAELEHVKVSPDNLAYVMYTSGSTGLPKGVGISHRAASQSLLAHEKHIPQFRRFLQFASPTFDVSVFEIFFPLFRGATLVGCERHLMLNELVGIMNDLQVDAAELTPTVAGELLITRSAVPGLRVLLTIGELLSQHVVDEFGFHGVDDGILYGMYGPTEATIHCTIATKFPAGSSVRNIGIPLDPVSAFVIAPDHPDGHPVEILPHGHVGELAVGGPLLADGYLNREQENKRAFVQSKFGRLYRTGDKARMHPNGELDCLGRISSSQIKLRGQRVELGEIESAIAKDPGARSAVVLAVDGVLVAFASKSENFVTGEDLRLGCQRWLPKFMVPRDIVCMDELPRLPSGKIDRKRLEQDYSHLRLSSGASEVSNLESDLERCLASCTEEILGSAVTISTSLAASGLDSLKAIKLSSRLRDVGIDCDVVRILEVDNVGQLAASIQSNDPGKSQEREAQNGFEGHQGLTNAALESLRQIGCSTTPQAIIPCSPIQIAMLSESTRNPMAYSNWIELEFGPGIGSSAVKAAFSVIAQRNEIVRSGFVQVDIPGYSYAQIIWSELEDDCFTETSIFDYNMSFGSHRGLLRPFAVEFKPTGDKLRALVHIHHTLYDGWSWELIMNDLADILTNKALLARPQYRLVNEYYSTHVSADDKEHDIQYWREQLDNAMPNKWPNFCDRRDIPMKLSTTRRALDIDLCDLDTAAARLKVSRPAIFQGAFAYLLSAYFDTPDVIFGTVSSGRTAPIASIEDIIGPCILTVPSRVNLGNMRSVRDSLAFVHNLNRQSLKHGFLPLRDIKKASGFVPEMSLFDSLFVWQDTVNDTSVPSAVVRELDTADFLEFTITVEFEIWDTQLLAKANFQESIIPVSQADMFLSQIEQLAALFIRDPDIALADVNAHLPPSVMSIENVDYARDNDLPSLAYGVDHYAKSDPHRVAIRFLDAFEPDSGYTSIKSVTFAELDATSNRLANYLEECGLQPGHLVAVVLEKSPQLYTAILAIIKTGAGYVPITPQTPAKRVNLIIDDAECRMCVTDSAFSDIMAESPNLQVFCFDKLSLNHASQYRPLSLAADSTPAYAVFTSGSTGAPKGVLVSHGNVKTNIVALSQIYPHKDGDSRLLQACSHAFDVSVFEIFYSWHKGMTLCAATHSVLFRDIEKVIRILDVTHLSLTATMASLVSPKNVPNVNFLVTAGEEMTGKVFQEWADKGLYQGYGPSETTNICTVKPDISASDFQNNIGRPLRNVSAFVISDRDEIFPVPRGGLGELCFGGPQVGLGYLNMPELTEIKFIDHPNYGKIYRSGDFGRLLPDGSLAFCGRRDDLVKVRGLRIELGEINSTIIRSPGVKDCVTVVCDMDSGETQVLISFWIPSEPYDYELSDAEQLSSVTRKLFERVSTELPAYMAPSFIIPISCIPMTAVTKVDKQKLLERFRQLDSKALDACACATEISDEGEPFSEIESRVAEAVSQITQSDFGELSRNASFYRLGLDSVSAIALSRRLKAAGFGQVDVSEIMKNSSVARLSRYLDGKNVSQGAVSQRSCPRISSLFEDDFMERARQEAKKSGDKVAKVLPCTPLQEAMLSAQTSDQKSAYINHLTFEVSGDIHHLRNAWFNMVQRHDVLRTRFMSTNDVNFSFAQLVLEDGFLPWEEIDASSVDLDAEINYRKRQFSQSPDRLPFQFIQYSEADGGKKQLHLLIHHALYDGESMARLLYEVEQVVCGVQLPPVVPYDQYLEQMISADVESADLFWSHLLDKPPREHLIVPNPGFAHQGRMQFRYAFGQLALPLAEIKSTCKNASVTLLNVFQTAWAKLIATYSGASDICFGQVFSCRSISVNEAERIVGPCFNTLPVRVKLDRNATNLDLMRRLHKTQMDILPHQLTSLRRLQSRLGANILHLFDTLLLVQNSPQPLDESIWSLAKEEGDMDFPLVMEIIPNQQTDKAEIYLHFDEAQISSEDAAVALSDFAKLAYDVLNYPSAQSTDSGRLKDGIPSFIQAPRSESDFPNGRAENTLHYDRNADLEEWSKEELEIRDILSSLAKAEVDKIRPWTTIFQLGLDSINAIQIAHRLKELGHNITSGDVMEGPSIKEISRFIGKPMQNGTRERQVFDLETFSSRHSPSVGRHINVPEAGIEAILPCTPTQVGMLATFINSEDDLYFNTVSLRSIVPLDTSRLRAAWAMVVDRNVMLRTGFCHIRDDHSPFAMVVYRQGAFPFSFHEIEKSEYRTQQRNKCDILERLNEPPWNIAIEELESHTIVHFSGLHALYDARSLDLIFSEVSQAYNENILPDVTPIEPTLGSILARSLEESHEGDVFWKSLGSNFRHTKFPDMNPVQEEHQVNVLSKIFSKPLQYLQDGCRDADITLQAAGQAAWARLLASYTGEIHVTYGVVLSGRTISVEAEVAIFPCLTTLPSSYRVDGRNQDMLRDIMQMNAKLMKHQFTPLTRIQRAAGLDSILFDTLFVFQKFSHPPSGHDLWDIEEQVSKTDYAVSIELIPRTDELEFCLTFNNDILPKEQAELLLRQLDWLLLDTIFSPESDCFTAVNASNPLFSSLLRKEFRLPSPVRLLHQFVETKASECPAKLALEFVSKSSFDEELITMKWTYKNLDDEANRHAHFLQQRGASAGDLIGVCFDKCPEAYFAILGILKIGCAYVALDPGAPFARKQFILKDAGVKLLLCTSVRQGELDSLTAVSTVALDEQGLFDNVPSDPPHLGRPIDPDATCYCLYTSGSTGTPKGCEITHDNAVQAMLSFQRLFSGHWDDTSRWLQFAAYHFDVSVLEQYWSWSVGICLVSCPRDILFEDLAGMIRQLEITHIDLTPSLASLLHPDEVPSLCRGVFITGGEKLKQEILDDWGQHRVIYNGYGPTEVTIGCTMLPRVSQNHKASNIGPQFDNVSAFVFKPGTELSVLRGGVGELCVSGPLVGRGYLNRPQLTSERFQFIEDLGERVYRTGDLVRMFHDGSFCFLGRIDDQVKLRGQRLEIEEINHVIKKSCDDISEVVTMVIKHPTLSKDQLVSFVTVRQPNKVDNVFEIDYSVGNSAVLHDAKKACHNSLPGYMVPTHVIPLFAFPLTPNNKIDNRLLIDLYNGASLDELQRLSPRGDAESGQTTKEMEGVIRIVAKVTSSDEKSITPWSNIFQLGVDSISAIGLARALKDAGFDHARPSLVMRNPTISALVDVLSSSSADNGRDNHSIQEAKQRISAFSLRHLTSVAIELEIPTEDIETVTPCTPLQEGMIYRKSQSAEPVYLSRFDIELEQGIDILRLESAWRKAQNDIQLLRTKFVGTDDGPALVVLKTDSFPWLDSISATDDELGIAAAGRYRSWCETENNFTHRPWEIGIFSGPNRKLMSLNIFHGLYDGNSLPLLLERVAQGYAGVGFSESPRYTDFLPQGPLRRVPDAKAFWVEHVKSSNQIKLSRIENTQMREPAFSILEMDELDSLESVRRKLNITEQAVVHACWIYSFAQHFKFVPTLGIISSGRALGIQDAENVIGPMFNTVPCYIPSSESTCLADLALKCHDYHISALPYQHTALRDIMKWSGRNVDQPLFDTLFTFQKANERSNSIAGSLWKFKGSNTMPDYPLAFEAEHDNNESLRVTVVAQGDVLTPEMAQNLTKDFRDTLSQFLKDPYRKITLSNDGRMDNTEETTTGNNDGVLGSQGSLTVNGSIGFQWTDVARRIQQEIAILASIDTYEITERTSILEAGLDSIDAVKLSSRLRKAGIKLSVSVIMNARTIQAMTEQAGSTSNDAEPAYDSLRDLETRLQVSLESDGYELSRYENILPATPLQEGMLVEMMASNYRHYFNHDILELEENVDIDRLAEAWLSAVRQHPILRTSFAQISDPNLPCAYAQLVHGRNEKVRWIVEYSGEKTLEEVIEDERVHALDDNLQNPPLSLRVLQTAGKYYLIVSISHALYDGWSLDLLHNDVSNFYAGHDCARPSYHKLLARIVRDTAERGINFWRGTLTGVPLAQFPKQSGASVGHEQTQRQERIFNVSASKIVSFCKKQGVTAQCLGVTCWSLVLAGYLGVLDFTFGSVLSGRDIDNAEQMMFPAMNTVAVRATIHGTRSELLKHMQRILANILEHQHFPLQKAKALAGASGQDLFDTLFIFQKRPTGQESHPKSLYRSVHSSSNVEFPVCAEMELLEETVVWRVACRDSHLGEKDTTDLLDKIEEALNDIVEHPDDAAMHYGGGKTSASNAPVYLEPAKELYHAATENGYSSNGQWTAVEMKIRSVISTVANVPVTEITKQTTIFHLGLDSISAIKVSTLLRKQSITLPVSDLLRAGTVPRIAGAVRACQHSPRVDRSELRKVSLLHDTETTEWLLRYGISPNDVEDVMPATSGQIYMLEMWHNSKGRLFYPPFFYQITGHITPEKLEHSWATLTRQLPILRTGFLMPMHRELRYAQVVMKEANNPIVWRTDFQNSLDLRHNQRPLHSIPVALHASYAPDGISLMLHIHHALYDAVSLSRIMSLLSALCNGIDVQDAGQVGMPEFLAFNSANSPLEGRKAFWQTHLEGSKQPEHEASRRNDESLNIVSKYRPSLIKDLCALETAARRHGLTIQAIFLAIYAKLHVTLNLGRKYSDSVSVEHVIIGVYLANRSHSFDGLREMTAPTLNIVPLCIRNPVQRPIIDLAWQVQTDLQNIGAAENSCVSLAEIADWTGIKLDTFVNFMKYPESDSLETKDSVGLDHAVEILPFDEKRQGEKTTARNNHSENKKKEEELENSCARVNGEGGSGGEEEFATSKSGSDVFAVPENAGGIYHRDIFKPGLDIEAAIRNKGLDVGIFGVQNRLDEALAETVLGKLRHDIDNLIDDMPVTKDNPELG